MSSALQLSAASSIINGKGLGVSANLTSAITTFQNQAPIVKLANLFATAGNANVSVSANLIPALSKLGVGVTQGQWLIDLYPANITAVSSGNVKYYSAANINTASFSGTLNNQAVLPFAHGMAGFANVAQNSLTYAVQVFDTVSSVDLLQNKTYSQSGIGYTSPLDLATNGINGAAPLIANVVANWGTMYDINNISTIGDPYVFGQNILNQGLGNYGSLSARLTSVGLNVKNLLQVPQSSTTVTHTASTASRNSSIGAIKLPSVANVTTTTVVSGISTSVVTAIYETIKEGALQSIVTATNITIANASITSLNDYLNFNTVVNPAILSELAAYGIVDFPSFGAFVQNKVGKGNFKSWSDLSSFLLSLDIPTLSYTTANANATILSSNTISTLNSVTGTGTGPFNNPVLSDYLGAATGVPYVSLLATINNNYSNVSTASLLANLTALDSAVSTCVYNTGNISTVQSTVSNINSILNSLTVTTALTSSQTAYYNILNKLTSEVTNLSDAGVVFATGTTQTLENFAQTIGTTASDSTQYQTFQFFSNLVTNDIYGDTVRSAIAESVNTKILASRGIVLNNDPKPAGTLAQAQQQNIPLSTYISQNQ
jgi:hypothetical protein